MATHHRCEWNCGGTECCAPRRPPREAGPAINLGFYAGTYGGYRTEPPKPRNLWQRFQAWRERTGFFMDGPDGGM
jgi:hypothetical protein